MRRLFIGVGFSSELRGYFQDAALMVEKYCETAKYTRRENFHLTVSLGYLKLFLNQFLICDLDNNLS